MRVLAGTSGFSYKEWKGSFYPEDLPAERMLAYYAERLPAVEINNTFYRMPKPALLESWAAEVPPEFRFVLKASQRITHFKRLKDTGSEVEYFFGVASTLGERLGPVLVQLPPNLKKDLPRLEAFLATLPAQARPAFEFRHASWFDAEVFARLRERNLALCVADSEKLSAPVEITADYAYFRLRDEGYTPEDIRRWGQTIAAHTAHCRDVFVYFKHEESGKGPAFARMLLDSLAAPGEANG